MKKRYTFIGTLLILSLLLAACNNSNNENSAGKEPNDNPIVDNEELEQNGDDLSEDDKVSDDVVDENTDTSTNSKPNDNSKEQLLTSEEVSNQIIEAILNEDMETVAHFVHPEKGLLFSPYIYVDDHAVVIEQADIANLLNSNEVFTWGTYDGKGTPIELTPAEYFEEFLDMSPFEEPDEILINDLQDRGNTMNNIGEKFPDAQIIEYYHGGSEEYAGIDWSSVLFIYEQDSDGVNQLIAIIRDMWTI